MEKVGGLRSFGRLRVMIDGVHFGERHDAPGKFMQATRRLERRRYLTAAQPRDLRTVKPNDFRHLAVVQSLPFHEFSEGHIAIVHDMHPFVKSDCAAIRLESDRG